jgi:transposase
MQKALVWYAPDARLKGGLSRLSLLMPAKDVKDAADAEAICEAVRRPTMRFVQVKSAEQQGQLMRKRREANTVIVLADASE